MVGLAHEPDIKKQLTELDKYKKSGKIDRKLARIIADGDKKPKTASQKTKLVSFRFSHKMIEDIKDTSIELNVQKTTLMKAAYLAFMETDEETVNNFIIKALRL